MPTLPAPSAFLPTGGGTPVTSTDDIIAAYPERVQREPVAPVRDAIVEMQTEILLAYQLAASYAAAQSDPTRSTGVYLEEDAAEVGVFRQDAEEDESLRDRLFSPPAVVTPLNIRAAVDAILAPVTSTPCVLWESVLDRLYVSNGAATWTSFVGDGESEMTPYYPDRRYDLRGSVTPGGPFTFSEGEGRFFILRVPDLSEADAVAAYAVSPLITGATWGLYADDGTGSYPSYAYSGGVTGEAIYATIINTVDGLKGHGIRWRLVVDPKLAA